MSRSPFGPAADRFLCPRCGAASSSPEDKEFGYCGRCHDYTGIDRSAVAAPTTDDITQAPGSLIGPGGPFDRGGVLVDNRRALLLTSAECAPLLMHGRDRQTGEAEAQRGWGLDLRGRRAQETPDGTAVRFDPDHPGGLTLIGNVDMLAALVTETMSLWYRHDPILLEEYDRHIQGLLTGYESDPPARDVPRMSDPGGAMIVDEVSVAGITGNAEDPDDPKHLIPPVVYEFGGRINKTDVRTSTVVIAEGRGPAQLLAVIMHAAHADREFLIDTAARLEALRSEGLYRP